MDSRANRAVTIEEEDEETGWRASSDSDTDESVSDWEPPADSESESESDCSISNCPPITQSATKPGAASSLLDAPDREAAPIKRRSRWGPPLASASFNGPRTDADSSTTPSAGPSAVPSTSRKEIRDAEYQAKRRRTRSRRRLEKLSVEKSVDHVTHEVLDWSVSSQRTQAGFAGFKAELPTPDDRLRVLTIPAGPFPYAAADVLDAEHRRIVYRAYGNNSTPEVSQLLWDASKWLQRKVPPTYRPGDEKHPRGPFPVYYFSNHTSFVAKPRPSTYFEKHAAVAAEFFERIQPAIKLANVVFKAKFPEMYASYDSDMTALQQHKDLQDRPLPRLFGVWASACINGGGRVSTGNHTDSRNRVGVCCVIAFGQLDHTRSARLVLEDLGIDIELPAGVPIFLPSSLLRHRNTEILGDDKRGSLVLWSAGDLSRWLQLGGRRVGTLSPDEKRAWKAGLSGRVACLMSLFPEVSASAIAPSLPL